MSTSSFGCFVSAHIWDPVKIAVTHFWVKTDQLRTTALKMLDSNYSEFYCLLLRVLSFVLNINVAAVNDT